MAEKVDKDVLQSSDLEQKRSEAQAALAGADWTAKHEREQKQKALESEEAALVQKLVPSTKEKEVLELNWIELDGQRRAIRAVLNPFLDEEKKIETEEAALETEEAKIGLPTDKHAVEEKRWVIQEKRQQVERKKWAEEEKLIKIEATIAQNTAKYRALLDEEEKIEQRRQQIKLELINLKNG